MQTKGEFTPGPWRVGADLIRVHPGWRDEHGNAHADCLHRNGYAKTIAAVGKEDGDWRGILQQCADARLIAAAPDLLEACSAFIERFDHGDRADTDYVAGLMRAAIARAKGLPS